MWKRLRLLDVAIWPTKLHTSDTKNMREAKELVCQTIYFQHYKRE